LVIARFILIETGDTVMIVLELNDCLNYLEILEGFD